MSAHTSFKVGGPADLWLRPEGEGFPAFAAALVRETRAQNVPLFILGGGANIVVADKGIRGIVLDSGGYRGMIKGEAEASVRSGEGASCQKISFRAGTPVDEAVETAASLGLGGLEFLAGMPGTIGGAVWMNARCYEREMADILIETELLDFSGPRTLPFNPADFGYKKSPFQNMDALILSAKFRLNPRQSAEIRAEMAAHRRDREEKGHYRYPSAGSAFKNNRKFGKSSGKIIDELGLRGFSIGEAQIAPFHGNIIINTGTASAADIRALVRETAGRVKTGTGFALEPEILFVGDWD
jgi:UDP-N-acetylmuramate dehydrogenase